MTACYSPKISFTSVAVSTILSYAVKILVQNP